VKEIFIISKLHTHAIIPLGKEAPSSLISVHPPLHLHQCNVQLLLGKVKAALNNSTYTVYSVAHTGIVL